MAFTIINNSKTSYFTALGTAIAPRQTLDLLTIASGETIAASLMSGELYDKFVGRIFSVVSTNDFYNLGATNAQLNFYIKTGFMQGYQADFALAYPFRFTSDGYLAINMPAGSTNSASIALGTEDGIVSGIAHAIRIGSDGYLQVKGASTYIEDSPHNTGDWGTQILSVRRDAAVSSAGADGDYATINTDADGFLYDRTKAYDPSSNADRVLPVTDLSAKRTPGDAPIPIIASAQTITNAWADLGPEISIAGFNKLRLWVNITKGDGYMITNQVRALYKHTSAGTEEYPLSVKKINSASVPFVITDDDEVINLFSTETTPGLRTEEWDVDNTTSFVQFQIKATTPGTTMVVATAFVTMGWC